MSAIAMSSLLQCPPSSEPADTFGPADSQWFAARGDVAVGRAPCDNKISAFEPIRLGIMSSKPTELPHGDLLLSGKHEILGTTSGMSWHFPWHQYQIAQSGIETEGEPFAPSMIITDSHDAAHSFRVELYDSDHKLLATEQGLFGKVYDRPFKQAFVIPEWFNRYTPSFLGMLEPGVTVPFGDGWQDVTFENVCDATFVRVVITKYWGIGGGLNEIQVYGK
jgi:hypothetical protein